MTLKIEYKDTEDLIPYINNPRNNENAIDMVASSIKNYGFKNPILIDEYNEIIAGHTRLEAAKKLGIEDVPTIKVSDLTENQIKAFRIADNKTSEFAEWDVELLESELADLEDEFTGFEDEELNSMFDDEIDEAHEDDYEVEVPEEPKAKLGDIYQLGRHRLMCGDGTEINDVQRLMDKKNVDLFLTDPPYNVDYTGKTNDSLKIENDKKEDSEFRQFLVDAFRNAYEVMNEGAAFYIWHADLEGYNFRGACNDVGLPVRQCLIWNKNSMVMGRQDYHWKHEPCLYGWKPGAGHLWASDRKQTTVLDFERPNLNKEHPTMKPVRLFDYQIQNNTNKEDVVLDIFGGSGTTIIACEQNGRCAYTMELDPKYVDVIINRWEEYTGKKAELIGETKR